MKKQPATTVTVLFIATAIILSFGLPADADFSREERIGREQARSFERRATLVDDPEVLERVRRIGNEIAQVARTVKVPASYGSDELADFDYQFQVVKDDDINAFSLPGGYIYVNQGLIDYADSDDELAGVLAHEIAHAAHHHMAALMKKQSSIDRYVALVAVLALLGDVDSADLTNLIYGAQFVKIAKMSGYGQEAELDADATAVHYLTMTSYCPLGLLTFLEKLASEKGQATRTLGILQTHPSYHKRSAAIIDRLEKLGIDVGQRRLPNTPTAVVLQADSDNSPRVMIDDLLVLRPAPANGFSSLERAKQMSDRLNGVLEAGLELRDLQLDCTGFAIIGTELDAIVAILEEDAVYNSACRQYLLTQAHQSVRHALWKNWVTRTGYAQLVQDR